MKGCAQDTRCARNPTTSARCAVSGFATALAFCAGCRANNRGCGCGQRPGDGEAEFLVLTEAAQDLVEVSQESATANEVYTVSKIKMLLRMNCMDDRWDDKAARAEVQQFQ